MLTQFQKPGARCAGVVPSMILLRQAPATAFSCFLTTNRRPLRLRQRCPRGIHPLWECSKAVYFRPAAMSHFGQTREARAHSRPINPCEFCTLKYRCW